ncbi:MAG: hypothetical protein ACFB15_08935 [Cyclobacteriaceae bacterium]|mgnify:CR=1 FL=1
MANPFAPAFEVFQNQNAYFQRLNDQRQYRRMILSQLLTILAFTFCYGLVMGSYHSLLQAVSSGMKLFLLFGLALLICFPSFYIVQLILGSKIRIGHMLTVILSGFVFISAIMLAFAPIVVFFQLTGDNYAFLQLLHVAVFVFAGIFGMRLVAEALKHACDQANVYPRIGVTIFRIWMIIFAFVGIQLAWNMRPFLGSPSLEFELFRSETQGNFYSTVLGATGKLLGTDQMGRSAEVKRAQIPTNTDEAPQDTAAVNEKIYVPADTIVDP